MKFAIVIPAYIYNMDRVRLANAFFASLLRTKKPGEVPRLIVLVKPSEYAYPWGELARIFDLTVLEQSAEGTVFRGIDQPLIYGTDEAFKGGAEYAVHLNEDALVHPNWLRELEGLIGRHLGATAWSVYRSAYVAVHAPIREEGDDVLVRSINGNGLTFSRDEWKAWGQDWHARAWPDNPRESGTVTLDYRHYLERPGERWVTRRSYVEHTGRDGTYCVPGIPEWAVDFAGTEE